MKLKITTETLRVVRLLTCSLTLRGMVLASLALALAVLGTLWLSSHLNRGLQSQPAQPGSQILPNGGTVQASLHQPAITPGDSNAAFVTGHDWPQANPFTRHLVATLTNLDFTQGPVTEEQADKWRHAFERLTEQGAEAVPAIHEFLAQNRELMFTGPSGDLLGHSSLRSAMINALAQIGGADATAALLEALQTTTLPTEIPLLARVLDEQSPGQYGQQILKAVTDVLTMASSGQLPPEWDVAPLFKLVQAHGDSTTASALQQFEGPYKYYATMALAGMPDGAGLPQLIQQSKTDDDPGRRDFAVQMLAQVTTQHSDADTALLELAKANQISDAAWRKMAIALAVDQYQIGEPPGDSDAGGNPVPGLKTFHVDNNNQNFYSLPLSLGDHVRERLALIDQLLEVTAGNPAAQAALRSAQATLTQFAAN